MRHSLFPQLANFCIPWFLSWAINYRAFEWFLTERTGRKKQPRKSWVLCFRKKEKAEEGDFYDISISGKHNNFENTLQIPRVSKEIWLLSAFYLVNQHRGIEKRRGKLQGKGSVQLRVLHDFFLMIILKCLCCSFVFSSCPHEENTCNFTFLGSQTKWLWSRMSVIFWGESLIIKV